ncbi:hypothetical protein C9374_013800 [Naegleria lovaniensis]|uniref:Uncharacterized protein n=1 Tax=Naegleria lovaniensis TaxID=51637 RepID=A0AA88GBF2_NAELO|nr:uncharacterized protein C9374_013800 [Naegleria lovaniensis]KAG2370844.1 hypothetical protein C9374_013800 [Naegleria lovaniensis]
MPSQHQPAFITSFHDESRDTRRPTRRLDLPIINSLESSINDHPLPMVIMTNVYHSTRNYQIHSMTRQLPNTTTTTTTPSSTKNIPNDSFQFREKPKDMTTLQFQTPISSIPDPLGRVVAFSEDHHSMNPKSHPILHDSDATNPIQNHSTHTFMSGTSSTNDLLHHPNSDQSPPPLPPPIISSLSSSNDSNNINNQSRPTWSHWLSMLLHHFFSFMNTYLIVDDPVTLLKRILKQLILINPYLRANVRRGMSRNGTSNSTAQTTSIISYHNHSLAPWQWSV